MLKIKSDNTDSCPICLESKYGKKVEYAACGHSFHYKCMCNVRNSKWTNKHTCPMCRDVIEERKFGHMIECILIIARLLDDIEFTRLLGV